MRECYLLSNRGIMTVHFGSFLVQGNPEQEFSITWTDLSKRANRPPELKSRHRLKDDMIVIRVQPQKDSAIFEKKFTNVPAAKYQLGRYDNDNFRYRRAIAPQCLERVFSRVLVEELVRMAIDFDQPRYFSPLFRVLDKNQNQLPKIETMPENQNHIDWPTINSRASE